MSRKQYGESILQENLGIKLVRGIPTARTSSPPIQWRKFCLNGCAPSAQFQNLLHEATNQAVVTRTRQLFTAIAHPSEIPASSTTQPKFRFAFRTSTYQAGLAVFVTMQPPLGANGDNASYVRLKIFSDVSEAVLVSNTDFYYGASPDGISFSNLMGWSFAKTIRMNVDGLAANTSYYARFDSESAASLQTATVIEKQSMTETFTGYLPTSINQDSEILSVYRQKLATLQKNLWKHAGGSLINWTVSDGAAPLTRTSLTPINIVDNSSTAVSTSTPGFTLDMRNRARAMQTSGVPCIMKVFGQMTAASGGGGRFYLKDSTGATVASILGAWTTTASWQSVSFNLPATLAKYDLHFSTHDVANAFKLYAASIWEYEV